MADVLTRFKSGKIWDFKGGIHPPEMKSQSNQSPIQQSELAHDFYSCRTEFYAKDGFTCLDG